MGRVGRAHPRPRAAPARAHVPVRARARAQRGSRRRGGAARAGRRAARRLGARRRRALHGAARRCRREGRGERARRGAPGAREQRGDRRARPGARRARDSRGAPRRRHPPGPLHPHVPRRRGVSPHARHRCPPRRAQAPRGRAARAGRARPATARSALLDHRRRPRAGRARRPRRAARHIRARRLPRAAAAARDARTHARLHAVRDALDRRGLRRGLRRGDGRGAAGDRVSGRAGAGGDRGGRRRLRARPARRHRAPDATHRRAALRPAAPARGRPASAGERGGELHVENLRRADARCLSRCAAMRPLLFVTGHVPAYRAGALAALHEREGIEVALFGGRSRHGGADAEGELPFPHLRASPAEMALLAARGDYRAVVCSTGGRLALPAAWAGARAGRRPVLLWASLWAHTRSAAHAFSYLPLRRLYRTADAVVTYGPHVSAYVRARGARNVHVAPQSVDNEFWRSREVHPPSDPRWPRVAGARVLFVGRAAPEKGLVPLLAAWSGVGAKDAALLLAGEGLAAALRGACPSRLPAGALPAHTRGPGTQAPPPLALGALTPVQLRDVYAACDVLVVPSVATATFREPWGLVVNEAMNRGL